MMSIFQERSSEIPQSLLQTIKKTLELLLLWLTYEKNMISVTAGYICNVMDFHLISHLSIICPI